MNLDESQLAFINNPAPNIRLLAPAGSGKTTTLLYRCKRLTEEHPGEKVLIFTFTRVACEELRQRLNTIADFAAIKGNVTVTTLNAYGNRLLKRKYVGYKLIGREKQSRHFILSNSLRLAAGSSPVIEENINNRKWVNQSSNGVIDLMDLMKSLGFDHEKMSMEEEFNNHCHYLIRLDLDGMLDDIFGRMADLELIDGRNTLPLLPNHDDRDPYHQPFENFVRFYAEATRLLAAQNQFTLEDQKYWGWKTMQNAPKVSGAARYAHIMVDEFQDINPVDLYFLDIIRAHHNATITVVGDDDQTIFEWRGATPKYILHPGDYMTDRGNPLPFETCILERNYRSPRNIVDISQRLIQHNQERVKKKVSPVSTEYAEIETIPSRSYDDVIRLVEADLRNEEIKKIAIVSRKRSHLIPYQIILAGRGEKFYAAEDLNVLLNDAFNMLKNLIGIKCRNLEGNSQSMIQVADDVMALCNGMLRFPLNKADSVALKDYMYGGDYDCLIDGISHFAAMEPTLMKGIVPGHYLAKMLDFANTETVADTIRCISEDFTGLKKDFRKADDDIFYADPPFVELADFAERYDDDFAGFCRDVERTIASLAKIIQDEDDTSEIALPAPKTKLYLMTGLRTKGKEFDSVYIIHSDTDIWPIKKAVEAERTEAERRLFYVAVTRAKKKLTFMTNWLAKPSPYLTEMGLL